MSALVVIPARYGSTRFPGKPLASLHGKPMIQHVYEQAAKAIRAEEVIVATDDPRILETVERFGGRAALTSASARSGTDRVAEVARARRSLVVINVQGDEPLIQPDMIDQLAEYLERHAAVPMASLMTKLTRSEDVANPNVVKVVVDRDGFALYFSRAPIPFVRQTLEAGSRKLRPETRRWKLEVRSWKQEAFPTSNFQPPTSNLQPPASFFKHLGIYGYQRHFLLQFPHLEPTPLEQLEQLEQLRALEHGYRLKLLETPHDTVGIDTPEDLKRVEVRLQKAVGSRQ